jgi:hypothetical protein
MVRKEESVPLKEAVREVEVAMSRVALLHLSFSRVLVSEFGEEKGKELIVRSILEYGKRIGERTMRGYQDLPNYGVVGRYEDNKAYDCVLARIFHECKEEDLGCLYCYVDGAKSMAVDPNSKFIHKTCAACGDDYCTFERKQTTTKERKDFKEKSNDWKNIDPRIVEGLKKDKQKEN